MKGCRPLSNEEVEIVAQSFGSRFAQRDKALFILGVKSGFRISELLSLRLGDVMKKGKMVERVTVQRRHMKKKVEGRTVVLHEQAKKAVQEWVQELQNAGCADENSPLFPSRQGGRKAMSRVRAHQILTEAFETNELSGKVSTHSMRKTFANKVYNALGGDLVKTQRALGHKNVNSTVSYLSFKEEEIDEAILSI